MHAGQLFGALAALTTVLGAEAAAIELRLIGVRQLAPHQAFDGTIVGGLSGIEYDAAHDRWLAVTDDKAEFGPARVYEVKIEYDANAVTAVGVTGMIRLLQPNGSEYPDRPHFLATGRGDVPDIEAVRLDPGDGSIWYASEGDRDLARQPFVRHASREGRFLGELNRPAMCTFGSDEDIGPRNNRTFEGLGFAFDGASIWLALESPLYEDGPAPTLESGASIRFTRLTRAGQIVAQFAYPIERIPAPAAPGKLADNGVSEILPLADGRLLVLERSGRQDAAARWQFSARLFCVDFAAATDVAKIPRLAGTCTTPGVKRLVFDFASAGRAVGNLEGLAWGRPLPNGHATIIVVADNNFAADQETQFWVFDVIPETKSPLR